MSKFGRKIKQAPEGFEYVEPTLTALDNELRESKAFPMNKAFVFFQIYFTTYSALLIHQLRSGQCPT